VDNPAPPWGLPRRNPWYVRRYVRDQGGDRTEGIGKVQGARMPARSTGTRSGRGRRDPTPRDNGERGSRRRFLQRVQYANQHIRDRRPGLKTDMGPTSTSCKAAPTRAGPRNPFNFDRATRRKEIWYYSRCRNLRVRGIREKNGFGAIRAGLTRPAALRQFNYLYHQHLTPNKQGLRLTAYRGKGRRVRRKIF